MKIFIIILLMILSYSTLIYSNNVDVTTEQPTIQKGINTTDSNLKILDKIHSLYSDMMTFFGIIVAFVVVLIPIFTNFYQTRKLKVEKENLKQELLKEINNKIKSHFDLHEKRFEKKIEKMGIEFDKKSEAIIGGVFHIQGRYNLFREFYTDALFSLISASAKYLKGEDCFRLQRVNKMIVKRCLPNIYNDDFEKDFTIEQEMIKLIALMKENNDKGRFTDIVVEMESELREAKERKRSN